MKKKQVYVPVNCGLRVTSSKEKYHQAKDKRYVAIDVQERQGSKPISPGTFEKVPKNARYEVVYEYHCPLGKDEAKSFQNAEERNQHGQHWDGVNQRNEYMVRQQENAAENARGRNIVSNQNSANHFTRDAVSPHEQYGVNRNTIQNSSQKIKNNTSPSQKHFGPVYGRPINQASNKNMLPTNFTGSSIKDTEEAFMRNDEMQDRMIQERNEYDGRNDGELGIISVTPIRVTTENYKIRNPQEIISGGKTVTNQRENSNAQLIKNSNGLTHAIQRNTSSKHINENNFQRQAIYGPVSGLPINSYGFIGSVEARESTLIDSTHNVVNYVSPDSKKSQGIRADTSPSLKLIRESTSPYERSNHQNQGKVLVLEEYRMTSNSNQLVANDDNARLGGPAFFQTQGRARYNQIARNSKPEYAINSRKQISTSENIKIGGKREKTDTKDTFEDFESNIGINSRHDQKNGESTREYSRRNAGKEDGTQGIETGVKGEYRVERGENGQMGDSKESALVKDVESKIVIGGNAEGKGLQETQARGRHKIQVSNEYGEEKPNIKGQQYDNRTAQQQYQNPEYTNQCEQTLHLNISKRPTTNSFPLHLTQLQQRKKRVSQYQQTGGKSYNFKRHSTQEPQTKRKKEHYKYNLYSVVDEQFNLKCATGVCVPNEICASGPKRQGWR